MKIIQLVQGTPEWHAWRAGKNAHGRRRRPASLVPVMMGVSPHMTRSELVRIWATGDEKTFTAWEETYLLAKGHEAEAAARPLLEEIMGEEFYPVTISDDDELNTASMDGLTMSDEDGFEHKLWNAELAAAIERNDPPAYIYWQLEGQLLAGSGRVKRIHLVCSDGTADNWASMVYERVPGRSEKIEAGWRQFEEDVANYQHVEVLPKAVADPVVGLPAVSVNLTGSIAIRDNLDAFGAAMQAYIEGLPKDPKTDQEFANAEQAVKVLQEAQDRLEAAEANALAQTESVDDLRRRVAAFVKTARDTRLMLNRLVDEKKKAIRADILEEGRSAFANHLAKQNERFERPQPLLTAANVPQPDFAGAMKGKKTIASLRDAVATTLANAKIAVNEVADRVDVNLKYLKVAAVGQEAIFRDLNTIVFKPPEDFAMLVKVRLDEEGKRQAEAAARLLEAQRERPPAPTPGAQAATTPTLPIGTVTSPAPYVVKTSAVGPAGVQRPTDDQIIEVLALHFCEPPEIVIAWLRGLDADAAKERLIARTVKVMRA